jgi:hypothetical protein
MGQGYFGLRAEAVSNEYLPSSEQHDEHKLARLQELGWRSPTGTAEASTPEGDPDGSTNHFVDWPAGAPVADLAVRTFVEVLGAAHPGSLEYKAFDSQGEAQVCPELGLRRATKPTADGIVADLEHRLLATLREATGLDGLEYDEDRDVQLVYGSAAALISLAGGLRVRIRMLMLVDVKPSDALLKRLLMGEPMPSLALH